MFWVGFLDAQSLPYTLNRNGTATSSMPQPCNKRHRSRSVGLGEELALHRAIAAYCTGDVCSTGASYEKLEGWCSAGHWTTLPILLPRSSLSCFLGSCSVLQGSSSIGSHRPPILLSLEAPAPANRDRSMGFSTLCPSYKRAVITTELIRAKRLDLSRREPTDKLQEQHKAARQD